MSVSSSKKREIRAILVQRFPKAFKPKGHDKIPLKIGIHDDIAERCPDIKPRLLKAALANYTNGFKYLMYIKTGAYRYDLDGNPVEQVTAGGEKNAAERIAKKRAWLDERHKAGQRKRTLSGDRQSPLS